MLRDELTSNLKVDATELRRIHPDRQANRRESTEYEFARVGLASSEGGVNTRQQTCLLVILS